MGRQRERTPLEDGLKLDLNKLDVQAIMKGEPTPRVIFWDPRYCGDRGQSAY